MRRVMADMHLPEICIAYGLTESSPGITMTPRDSTVADRSQTVGVVLPELEVRIVDPATASRARRGERGELCVRGYNVMKGYYNNPEATRRRHHGGRLAPHGRRGQHRRPRTGAHHRPHQGFDHPRRREHLAEGDRGLPAGAPGGRRRVRLRPAGRLLRRDRGGGRSREAQDGSGGAAETPCADDLIRWCSDRLARFKVPKDIRFVTEFPMTASGKVQKFKLREEHLG